MQELVGRLTALDPEACETLKVVAYFDALVAGGVGLDGLLRGAAVLSGAVAGAQRRGGITRCDPTGRRLGNDTDAVRFPERDGSSTSVWLEREGPIRTNDEMIVERLALAVEVLDARLNTSTGLDIVIDGARTNDERIAALAKLRIDSNTRIRLIATSARETPMPGRSTVVPTRYGMLRAALDLTGRELPVGTAGLGTWVRADHAPESWDAAVIALRLTDPSVPVVDATDLGAMLLVARTYEPESPHADVLALARLDPRSAEVLRALVDADSIRGAAAELAMHHSTVQARHEALTRELGYNPRSTAGRMRYIAAAILLRLADRPVAQSHVASDDTVPAFSKVVTRHSQGQHG
ncbi:hypothetical protein [Nocardia sp. NPDC004711]